MVTPLNEKRILIAKKAVTEALMDNGIKYQTRDKEIHHLSFEWEPLIYGLVGSTYISDKEDSDVDIIVYVDQNPSEVVMTDWSYGGSHGEGNTDMWESWKRIVFQSEHKVEGVGPVVVNAILTNNKEYFNSWMVGAEVCRFLHLRGIHVPTSAVHGVHGIIMDNTTAEEELDNRKGY